MPTSTPNTTAVTRPNTYLALLAALTALAGCEVMEPILGKPAWEQPSAHEPVAGAPTAGGGPTLTLSSARGAPGRTVTVTVTLQTGGASIAGAQNDISFDPFNVAIASKPNGKPDCTANASIGKEGTAFSFQPPDCHSILGQGCTAVRALVLSLNNVDPIPNGSVLYTCRVAISPQAKPGSQSLALSRVGFSSPSGQSVSGGGTGGTVLVGHEPKAGTIQAP